MHASVLLCCTHTQLHLTFVTIVQQHGIHATITVLPDFLMCCLYSRNHIVHKSSAMSRTVHSLQVGGFLQRIDYVRKYAFGVMCILKNSEGQFPIRGFWIFRGQDIPQMMKDECYDLELYNWEKLDSKALNAVSNLPWQLHNTDRTALLTSQLVQHTLLLLLVAD